jgi:hypothetical protein
MDDFIQLPAERRRQLCEVAGDKIGLDAPSVEKDFWVCWTLRELFTLLPTGPHLTFKGGTSLSKCWKLIERFSEDIDVVIGRDFLGFAGNQSPEAASSNKKRDQRLEALKDACQKHIREIMAPVLVQRIRERLPSDAAWKLNEDVSDPDGQTLLFEYPSAFPAGSYLRPVVKIELGARSDTEPSAKPMIQPYLAEALPEVISPCAFPIHTVTPERTFWEKAMLLHEETFRTGVENPKARLARHYYDLWCLIRAGVAERAAADVDLFARVAAHRAVFFRKKKEAQASLRPGTLRLLPLPEQRIAWKRDYEAMRETMFFGEVPTFDEILRVVGNFAQQFNQLKAPPQK